MQIALKNREIQKFISHVGVYRMHDFYYHQFAEVI